MIRQSNVFRRRQIDQAKRKGEPDIAKAVYPLFQQQLKWVTRDLRKGNLRHRLKKNDGVLYKAGAYPDNWMAWRTMFKDTLRGAVKDGAGFLWTAEQKYFASYGYDPMRIDMADVIDNYMLRGDTRITDIDMYTEAQVNRIVADWYNTDAGLPDLIAQLSNIFGETRAEMIASTEMAYVASTIAVQQMNQYGITNWYWDAFDDGVTCEVCLDLMAQSKANPFTLSDPMPPDISHPRCRCGVYYVGVDVQI